MNKAQFLITSEAFTTLNHLELPLTLPGLQMWIGTKINYILRQRGEIFHTQFPQIIQRNYQRSLPGSLRRARGME